ncbi:MAG: DUF445 family protein [Balneolaceae bacterium]
MNKQSDKPTLYQSARDTTGIYVKKLGDILSRHGRLKDLIESPTDKAVQKGHSPHLRILVFLKPFPWILGILFIFSFYWDFNNMSTTLFNYPLQFEGLLRIICVSGLIGFLTNWAAITMLFRPTLKRPLLGQGLIPAHKDRIAYRLSFAVSEDLINPTIIKEKLQKSDAIRKYRERVTDHVTEVINREEFRTDIKQWISDYTTEVIADPNFRRTIAQSIVQELDSALENRLFEKTALKAYSLVSGRHMQGIVEDAIKQLPNSVEKRMDRVDAFLDSAPEKLSGQIENIEAIVTQLLYQMINQLDVQKLVEQNLQSYDENKLEKMIRGATNEQLKTIQYLGAVLGTIGGLVIWEPLLSLGMIALGFSTIYILDMWMGD